MKKGTVQYVMVLNLFWVQLIGQVQANNALIDDYNNLTKNLHVELVKC